MPVSPLLARPRPAIDIYANSLPIIQQISSPFILYAITPTAIRTCVRTPRLVARPGGPTALNITEPLGAVLT